VRPAALITGSAKRVGRAIALHFAERGFDIALHYNHSKDDAEQTASDIRALGVGCKLFPADLASHAALAPLVSLVHTAFPNLSVLINSASTFDAGRFMESDIALYQKEFAINTQAPIFLTQAFAKIVKQGAVVNMLDTMITNNKHSCFFYLLSKKTLAEFTKMAAVECAPNIRVNGVCPGYILPGGEWNDEYKKRLEPTLPLQKTASLYDVAEAVYSLATNSAITGQFLFIDGGEHLL